MRSLWSLCLVAASLTAFPAVSSAGENKQEQERLKSAPFNIVLVVHSDGRMTIEGIEPKKMENRQKELVKVYAEERKSWQESFALFRKFPENKGEKFTERRPLRPTQKVLQSRIKGNAKAEEARKGWEEKWLKPFLKKKEARAEAKALKEAKEDPRNNPEFLPKGNQVKNGGFEEFEAKDRIAEYWSSGQWGGAGKKYSVRRSKANPHEGECSVVLYSMTDGAKPGVSTSMKLPPVKYEIRYWVCADAGKTASIQASLGGSGPPEHSIGEEWEQIKETVDLEKKSPVTELRIWTTTNRVRVYLDDVEVEAVE